MSDQIAWVPVLDLTDEDIPLGQMPLTTFETGAHGDEEGVPVPEAGGAVIDKEIAELVALLNRAGVTTFQSCQDIGRSAELGALVAEDDGEDSCQLRGPDGDEVRFGCIVVEWDQFPKVGPLLPPMPRIPGGRWPDRINRTDGWLFSASPNARYVSILFPWSDLARWIEALKADGAAEVRRP